MKKGQVYEGMVETVLFPNKGIITLAEGKKVIVKNTIEGQRISFSINKVRGGKGEGRLLAVLEPSIEETEKDVCAHFGVCGGCTFLSLSREAQLNMKQQQVLQLLHPVCEPYGGLDKIFEGIKGSPQQFAYRNKMEFSFGDMQKDGPLTLGMHKRGSFHDVVTAAGCRIVDADFSLILQCVLEFFQARGITYFHKMRHVGYLRHLLVRKGQKTGEILVDLITTTQMDAQIERALLDDIKERLVGLSLSGRIVGILHTENDRPADAVIDQGTQVLFGRAYFYEELLGLRFRISPFSFFQTNSLGAEVLYETVREYVADVGKDKVVYDLYCGTGTIAQLLAPVAGKVIGVEIVDEAVAAAELNAQENGLCNCSFIAGDVLKVLDDIAEKPDFIVLDPPRDGVHPKALMKIIQYQVERMVYISCKPTSLARDLAVLLANGYRVERACCVDLFPGSANVETIVGIRRIDTNV